MKNIIIIDVDSDRDEQLTIGKPTDVKPPTTPQEAKNVIINDISCVHEAFKTMVMIADHSGYAKKDELLKTAIQSLTELLNQNNDKTS